MKYLYRQQRTKDLLSTWSANTKVIIAAHFFWKIGGSDDRTPIGCYKSLLRQLLSADNNLIEFVHSVIFNEAKWTDGNLKNSFIWCSSTLRKCLKKILCSSATFFCIFLDGLDELSSDEKCLAGFISALSESLRTKFCISSGPLAMLRKAIPARSQLSLQDFNRIDISLYATSRLQPLVGTGRLSQAQCDELINDINSRSEGMFLWAKLYVMSQCQSLARGHAFEGLRRSIELQDDLGPLFGMFITSIPFYYRRSSILM